MEEKPVFAESVNVIKPGEYLRLDPGLIGIDPTAYSLKIETTGSQRRAVELRRAETPGVWKCWGIEIERLG